jgi:serine/threonine protein kinase/tetratricopeptide (TPR) repeat protein
MAHSKGVVAPGTYCKRGQVMTPERWRQVEALFEQAVELPAGERHAFLNRLGDEQLRREVESLIESDARAQSFTGSAKVFCGILEEEDGPMGVRGQLIGQYRIVRKIGRGGMGVVYLAERADQQYEKRVAIKLIKRGMDTDSALRHFRNERQILASLDHPNIARLLDGGATEHGLPYFVMEYVEGLPIDTFCDAHALSITERLTLFREVCAAVAYAHDHTVIHRDIKPSNILVTKDAGTASRPRLLDFGIAKMVQPSNGVAPVTTITGLRPMTPEYASPEQVREQPLTTATDVYSLGVVLYQLLTGRGPYRLKTRTPAEISCAILDQEPPPPSTAVTRSDGNSKSEIRNQKLLKGDLDNIVLMALRKEPERRYRSVKEFSDDIRRHLERRAVWARPGSRTVRLARWTWRNPALAGAAIACLLLATAVSWLLLERSSVSPSAPTPEKSVAVLPFENLSNDRDDASFADGIQDDILTKLAKIADLKVISRTSVMQYRGQHNTRDIGNALGVSHVLEGSVRKTGAWLHINAQLIDTRTDTHVWAEQYDRDLKEVFALQGEVAQKVAERLHAKISAAEKIALEQPITIDVTAFNLYNRAKNFLLDIVASATGTRKESCMQAANLLNEAVAHDTSFFQAYCQLAWIHDFAYFDGWDRTSARLALAETAIQAAFRLHPDAGEAHLARAWHLYWGYRDYVAALAEVEKARPTLPNESLVFQLTGYIQRRQGRWEESKQNLERALDVDPRNFLLLRQLGILYEDLRRYADQEAILDRALALRPDDLEVKMDRANVEMDWKANTTPVHQLIDEIRAKKPEALESVADFWLSCALSERDPAAAAKALAALGDNPIGTERIKYGPRLWEGLLARMTKDDAKARAVFTAARAEQEKLVRANPDDAGALCILGLIDAGLGRKEEALSEGRRAVALLPVEKDARGGPAMIVCFARIATWVGEKDVAFEQLARAARLPSSVNYGDLKLMPWYDPLRGDPRFEKIVASLAPK